MKIPVNISGGKPFEQINEATTSTSLVEIKLEFSDVAMIIKTKMLEKSPGADGIWKQILQ